MTDKTLQERMADDLDATFEHVVLEYQDRIYRFALRLCGRREDAEEIAQDAFVRAYRAIERYPEDRIRTLNLRPWLYTIALNVFKNRIRRVQPSLVEIDDDLLENRRDGQPESQALAAEDRRELASLLLTLPETRRAAVLLRHVEDLSYAEIALVLQKPEGTVKADVHRGMQALRAEASRATGALAP